RYFCPASIVLLCFLIRSLGTVRLPRVLEMVLILLLLAGTYKNAKVLRDSYRRQISISTLPGAALAEATTRYVNLYERFITTKEPAFTDAAYGYYFPDADFAVQSMGVDEARRAFDRWRSATPPPRR